MTAPSSSNSRDEVLSLLAGTRTQRVPCFSGLISVTAPGLDSLNLRLSEVHTDPVTMAAAAASTYHLFGFESVVAPLDMCVEAQALGASVDYREASQRAELPRVSAPLADSADALELSIPAALLQQGRLPVVTEALGNLRAEAGQSVVVGGWVPGPFTLAAQLVDLTTLITDTQKAPESVGRVLDVLTDVLAQVALAYRSAGADFVTVHEMGGSPGFLGPPTFSKLVLPRLKRLLAALPAPRLLSVCGNTNRSMELLAEAGADAISVDQLNNLAHSREVLGPEPLLFGNIDPVGILAAADETGVRQAVTEVIESGVDAVWPACDLWPSVPEANMHALVDQTRVVSDARSNRGRAG